MHLYSSNLLPTTFTALFEGAQKTTLEQLSRFLFWRTKQQANSTAVLVFPVPAYEIDF